MVRPFNFVNGIAYPKDLKVLNDVFDRLCMTHGFEKESSDAEELGQAAMSLFAAGVFEEGELIASLEEFLRRRTRFIPSNTVNPQRASGGSDTLS